MAYLIVISLIIVLGYTHFASRWLGPQMKAIHIVGLLIALLAPPISLGMYRIYRFDFMKRRDEES